MGEIYNESGKGKSRGTINGDIERTHSRVIIRTCCLVSTFKVVFDFDVEMEIAMDEDLNDPVKKYMMKYINMLHCSDLHHPEGSIVTAPFTCLVGEFLIKEGMAVFDGDLNDEVSKNKDIDICHGSDHQFVPWNVFAHRDCVVTKILIKDGMLVKKGEPLYECDLLKGKKVTMPISSILSRSSIKKILDENHSSRVGIFSMDDELVDPNHAENSPMAGINKEDVLKRYKSFKKFEFVVDHSDHFFSALQSFAMNQLPKDWVNKIHEEWRILEECMPETIFVRVYESRIDLLRAVII